MWEKTGKKTSANSRKQKMQEKRESKRRTIDPHLYEVSRSIPFELTNLHMPLPRIKTQCRAKAKSTQCQCKNPTAYKMPVCRMHGARRPETILHGADHPMFTTGNFSQVAKMRQVEKLCELRQLEDLAHAFGLMDGKKTPGRKPLKRN